MRVRLRDWFSSQGCKNAVRQRLNREDLLWAKAVRVSRQAVSERFLSFPYGLFEQR
jgi:hypothetical protein